MRAKAESPRARLIGPLLTCGVALALAVQLHGDEGSVGTPEYQRIAAGLKSLTEISVSLNGWALLILGGILAVVLSTSYRKPHSHWRLIFFLFLPSLALLIRALERGNHVQSVYTALLLRPPTDKIVHEHLAEANTALVSQVWAFQWAVIVLGVWLAIYMIWWVWFDVAAPTATRSEE